MYEIRQDPPKQKKNKSKLIYAIVCFLILISGAKFLRGIIVSRSELEEKKVISIQASDSVSDEPESIFVKNSENKNENFQRYTVAEGDTPAKIFSSYGKLDANDTEAILAAAEGVYDFTGVRLGKDTRFYFDGEEKATRIEYDRDTERTVIVERNGKQFEVREEKIAYDVSLETARGKIDNFFYADALEAGLSEPTVLEVGDIFSYSIDFTTEIRQGDEFSFVYEKRSRSGERAPDGRILAAKFINDGTTHYAYYFENDGNGGYYDGEGRVLERQFLKAPLSFSRITSGYTGARMHPITRKVTAHYQIDYAAPTGTPVVSTARGTVISAKYETGWGNIVRISHDNGYTTHYGHLSAFAKGMKSGIQVSQGEVIAYVGSTGWSTGPHLDFGMKLNGAPVNPLKLDLPKGKPLDENNMVAFEELKKKYADLVE